MLSKLPIAVRKNSLNQGFVLLEIVIAIVILTITLLSFFRFISPVLSESSTRPLFLDTIASVTSSSLRVTQKCETLNAFGFECRASYVDAPLNEGGNASLMIDTHHTGVSSSSWYLLSIKDPLTSQKFFMVVHE